MFDSSYYVNTFRKVGVPSRPTLGPPSTYAYALRLDHAHRGVVSVTQYHNLDLALGAAGRRPKLESNDEFSLWTLLCTDILRCENVVFHWPGTLYRELTLSWPSWHKPYKFIKGASGQRKTRDHAQRTRDEGRPSQRPKLCLETRTHADIT